MNLSARQMSKGSAKRSVQDLAYRTAEAYRRIVLTQACLLGIFASLFPSGANTVEAQVFELRYTYKPSRVGIPLAEGQSRWYEGVVFTRDSAVVGSCGSEEVFLWELKAGTLDRRLSLPGDLAPVNARVTPDRQRVVCSSGSTILIWKYEDGVLERTIKFHDDRGIGCVSDWFSNKELVMGCDDGAVVMLNVTDGSVRELASVAEPVQAIAYCKGTDTSSLWAVGETRTWLFRTSDYTSIGTIPVVCRIASNRRGDIVALVNKSKILLRNSMTGELIRTISVADFVPSCMSFDPDGRHIAIAGVLLDRGEPSNGAIQYCEIDSGKVVDTMTYPETSGAEIAFSWDGNWLGVSHRREALRVFRRTATRTPPQVEGGAGSRVERAVPAVD